MNQVPAQTKWEHTAVGKREPAPRAAQHQQDTARAAPALTSSPGPAVAITCQQWHSEALGRNAGGRGG